MNLKVGDELVVQSEYQSMFPSLVSATVKSVKATQYTNKIELSCHRYTDRLGSYITLETWYENEINAWMELKSGVKSSTKTNTPSCNHIWIEQIFFSKNRYKTCKTCGAHYEKI